MNAGELIRELQKVSADAEVILQRDAEGNGYSPLRCVDGDCIYLAETPVSGEAYSCKWAHKDVCMPGPVWDAVKLTEPKCVVLSPRN